MNAHRLHFLRRFANAINIAVTMPPNISHQTQLHHALTALQQTRKAGIAAEQALIDVNSQDPVVELDEIKAAPLELAPAEIPQEIVAILTQPIIWQEQQLSEVAIVKEAIATKIEVVSSPVETLRESVPVTTAYRPQKKTAVDLMQSMATSYFQTLPWQTPSHTVNDSSDNSDEILSKTQRDLPKTFVDPWNIELATQFFSSVSWTGKSVQRLSINAGDGANEGTIEPNIITSSIVATQYLQPVNQFFSQLPWGGSQLH